MAQYYNLVTNPSTFCTVDGQRVQLVVEDVNNGGNGSQQLVAYATAPQNSEQTIFSPQAINLGNQVTTARLEQGQNVFIIKTNNIAATQEIVKSNTLNPCVVNENIASVVDNTGIKAEYNNEGQQIQWIKMQDTNATTVAKQNILLQEKKQIAIVTKSQIQNNIATVPLCLNSGQKRTPKFHNSKNRQLTNSIQAGAASQMPNRLNVITTMENRIQDSNVTKSASSTCGKAINPGQNITVRPIRASNPCTPHVQPVAMVSPEICKTPRVQYPDMQHLSEQIKQAKLKQMQLRRQGDERKSQQMNAQRQQISSTLQHPIQSSLTNFARGLIAPNSAQQRLLQVAPCLQGQQTQKSSISLTPLSPDAHDIRRSTSPMDIDNSECSQEKGQLVTSPSSPRVEHENNSSESVAYLRKTIHDPVNTIVQHQVKGNTAKMLVMLATGEQRLVTFDIPNEDCTVHDLLEQVHITFCNDTTVSLVDDPALGINYIVEAGNAALGSSYDTTDHSDCNSSQEIMSSSTELETTSKNRSSSDENSNAPLPSNEEPILVKGMLALCPHCGYSSLYFNRCERCSTKLTEEVKSIPIGGRKETGLPVDMFYKKSSERNATKLEKVERDGSMCKRSRGKGKVTASKPKPINKEPECLTISSDEEEGNKIKKIKTEGTNNITTLGNASNVSNEDMDTILDKEPIITNSSLPNSCDTNVTNNKEDNEGTGVCDNQNFIDNGQLSHTSIQCRTVRIGSYKYIPREDVVISQNGVRFRVPLLEDDTNFVNLNVKFQDIIKVLIHFGKTMPVLFFYTSTNTAAMIRELLGMQDPKGPYYDPAGKDHTHKRITLLPEKLSEDSKTTLKSLFLPKAKMEELNPKEANDILLRASPMDNSQPYNTTRRLSQSSMPNTVGANDGIQTITVYPPPPAKGGIAINTEDYLCLGEDQFLNDVIIDFYLKYLTLEVLSESDQHRTHVFSSYFYKRLTSPHAQAAESSVPMTPAAKRHARVQKWTKNVNIFEKDFVIIPINEHAHWFLAIICFPGLVGKVSTCVAKINEDDAHKIAQKTKKIKEVKTKAVTIGCTTITPVPATITIDQLDDGSERDEAEGDDEEMEIESDEEDENEQSEQNKIQDIKPEQNILQQQEETMKIPCILIFDSLAGASRARVVATLRDYLSCEYIAKLSIEKTFSKDTIKGACPKVPQQSNFTDCGLYVLQYVESFFKDPIKNYTLPIKTLKTWFEEIVVTRKREELSKLLTKLMNATKGDKTISLPSVNFPTQDGKLKQKSENHTDVKAAKSELENKRKSMVDAEKRIISMSVVTENTESANELVSRTYQFIPYSPCISSNSTENNSTEMLTESKTLRSSSETMSYLKSKRIPRLSRMQNQDDASKKHKGESSNSCK